VDCFGGRPRRRPGATIMRGGATRGCRYTGSAAVAKRGSAVAAANACMACIARDRGVGEEVGAYVRCGGQELLDLDHAKEQLKCV
jgi:hypothetical protein